jgi:hypothetical protein
MTSSPELENLAKVGQVKRETPAHPATGER